MDCCDITSFVATLILLCRNIIALCRDKDWFSLLEITVNNVVTLFFLKLKKIMSQHTFYVITLFYLSRMNYVATLVFFVTT